MPISIFGLLILLYVQHDLAPSEDLSERLSINFGFHYDSNQESIVITIPSCFWCHPLDSEPSEEGWYEVERLLKLLPPSDRIPSNAAASLGKATEELVVPWAANLYKSYGRAFPGSYSRLVATALKDQRRVYNSLVDFYEENYIDHQYGASKYLQGWKVLHEFEGDHTTLAMCPRIPLHLQWEEKKPVSQFAGWGSERALCMSKGPNLQGETMMWQEWLWAERERFRLKRMAAVGSSSQGSQGSSQVTSQGSSSSDEPSSIPSLSAYDIKLSRPPSNFPSLDL